MRVPLALVLTCALLLSGCSSSSKDADEPPRTADDSADLAAPAPAADDAGIVTTDTSWTTKVSFAAGDLTFFNEPAQVRDERPATLTGTLIEARLETDGPLPGHPALRIYGSSDDPVENAVGDELAVARAPDADGVYRIRLAPDDWVDGALNVFVTADGEPGGATREVAVRMWTTTFEGVDEPTGFTAAVA